VGRPQWGLGYGGYLPKGQALTFSTATSGEYERVEFRGRDRVVGRHTGDGNK
jgi:hypothetical protein